MSKFFRPDWVSHPGESLGDFVAETKLTQRAFAKKIGIHPVILCDLIAGRRRITIPVALKLDKAGVGSAEFWLTRQMHYDLGCARLRKRKRKKALRIREAFGEGE